MDGSPIKQLDIEPFKQFKLIVEAADPDNNPLEYKFDSESGTFAGITSTSTGCTAVFKTGRVLGGQNVEFWAGVSDGRGALVRQSYNLGTGKLGPSIVASLEKIRFRPGDKIKLTVTANCSGFFQLYSNGNNETEFKFENDMFRYSYSENKTTELILGGPKCASFADIQLEPRVDGIYGNDPNYNIVLVFRDGLFQTSRFIQEICVDGTPPEVVKDGFSPTGDTISTNPAVTVTFDEEIGYADSSCLKLDKGGSVKLVSINGNTVRFAVSGLNTSTPYTATVSGIKDIAGNTMATDSSYSFITRSDGNTKFFVVDAATGKNEYTAYCGFENANSTVTLKATLNGGDAGVVTYTTPQNSDVSISGNKITVKTHDLNYDAVKNITVTATSSSNDIAEFIVTIEPWYIIKDESDFGSNGAVRKNLNGRFKLGNEISFNAKIEPIGSYTAPFNNNPFTGIFDGEDKTLSNLTIEASDNYAGLFAYNKGMIKNVVVDSASFIIAGVMDNLGIIAGYNEGRIENCEVNNSSVKETDSINYPSCYVGGIAGKNKKINDDFPGLITGCSVESIVIEAHSICGSIVGYNINGEIQKCSSSGSVTGSGSTSEAGGLVGSSLGGKITGCSSSCDVIYVTPSTNSDACVFGGLIGYVNNSVITDCFSTGAVRAGNANNVGGLIGWFESGTIQGKIYSTANVTGNSNIGGLIGKFGTGLAIEGSSSDYIYSSGTVTGNSNVGGLIGYVSSNTQINYCKSTSSVIAGASPTQNFGGLIGYLDSSTVKNSYHDTGSVSGKSYVGGLIGYAASSSAANQIESCHAVCTVNGTSNYVGGLIGATGKATIQGKTHASGSITGIEYVGGLIGRYNVTSELVIRGTDANNEIYSAGEVKGNNYVGGLIGSSAPGLKAEYCYSDSSIRVNTTGIAYFGGLIGYLSGLSSDINATFVKNCYSKGSVGNEDDSWTLSSKYIGGLIGFMQYATVSDCYSTDSVFLNQNWGTSVGGLIGQIFNTSKVFRCRHTYGYVSSGSKVGGLIGEIIGSAGENRTVIEECFADSEVRALDYNSKMNAGGLIGSMNNTDVVNCYSRGTVWSTNKMGGLIGCIENGDNCSVSKCYSDAELFGSSGTENGELIGNVISSEIYTYQDSIYLERSYGSSFGSSKTQGQMQTLITYSSSPFNWEIAIAVGPSEDKATWLIKSGKNDGFPYLRENPPQ